MQINPPGGLSGCTSFSSSLLASSLLVTAVRHCCPEQALGPLGAAALQRGGQKKEENEAEGEGAAEAGISGKIKVLCLHAFLCLQECCQVTSVFPISQMSKPRGREFEGDE